MNWELYALRFASQARTEKTSLFGSRDLTDRPQQFDFYVWLLRSGSREIVIDTGFKGLGELSRARHGVRTVSDALEQLGTRPESVKDVILTHLHFDHTGNLDLFPNARFHLQQKEMAYATGKSMCHAPTRELFVIEDMVALLRAVYDERVVFYDGEGMIAPGVNVYWVGGHTAGLQIIRIETERGAVVLASDASHLYQNMERSLPFPLVYNFDDIVESWAVIRRLADGDADRIIPGHDPEIRRRYPAVAGSGGNTVALHMPPLASPQSE
jgi:glyoxylase-like metal-dependent hydrolase (beta-lactamase superfamily II)